MSLKKVMFLQKEFSGKLGKMCTKPTAHSSEEVELWQTDYEKYLAEKAKYVELIPTTLESDIDDMFIKTRDFYYSYINSWYSYGMESYQMQLLNLKYHHGEILKEELRELRQKVMTIDFERVSIEEKVEDFLGIFEEIIDAIKNNQDWFDLYKASFIRGDDLVFNISSLDLFTWQLPNADTRNKNDYAKVAKIMTIFFFFEKIYKNESSLSNGINPLDKVTMDISKILAYYNFTKEKNNL